VIGVRLSAFDRGPRKVKIVFLFRVFFYPVEVSRRAVGYRQSNNLRNGIGVEGLYSFGEVFELRLPSLDQQQPFLLVTDLSLPSVDRTERGDHVGASGKLFFHEHAGNLQGFIFRTTSDKYDNEIRQGPPPPVSFPSRGRRLKGKSSIIEKEEVS
jgi:hypothetical protein